MMDDRVALEKAIGLLLKHLGFKRSRATWHCLLPEAILVLNIQKSEWGPRLYVNLGVYLRGLGEEAVPPEHKCHLRTRLDSLCLDPTSLVEALDLNSSMPIEHRVKIVEDAISHDGLPWLRARETEAKARTALLAEKNPTGLVMAVARKHLGIDGPV